MPAAPAAPADVRVAGVQPSHPRVPCTRQVAEERSSLQSQVNKLQQELDAATKDRRGLMAKAGQQKAQAKEMADAAQVCGLCVNRTAWLVKQLHMPCSMSVYARCLNPAV